MDSLSSHVFTLSRNGQFDLLHSNSDASAGVTSFNALSDSFQVTNSEHLTRVQFVMLVGSYDEQLRLYRLGIELDSNFKSKLELQQAQLLKSIHIQGGGIWRMATSTPYNQFVLLSAMYSGVHAIHFQSNDPIEFSQTKLSSESSDAGGDLEPQTEQLIYGLACNHSMTQIVYASFYRKCLFSCSNKIL